MFSIIQSVLTKINQLAFRINPGADRDKTATRKQIHHSIEYSLPGMVGGTIDRRKKIVCGSGPHDHDIGLAVVDHIG